AGLAIALLILFFGVGITGLAIPSSYSLFVKLTSLSLLLSICILMLFHSEWKRRLVIFFLMVAIGGFLLEVIGVNTGMIFGEYTYGSLLGIQLWSTPLLIGVNWLILIYTTWDMTGRIRMPVALRILVSGILMVIFDFILEPAATNMGLWTWSSTVIPIQNYLAWFIISILFFILAARMRIELRNKISISLWLILFTFFLLFRLLNI
ncbi:MAG: carotenoid biosynthesis protein, partial [Bacteroidales bacterium]|nr:carotenoid biosynthesis protein [Bacteroidales bacterium]